MPVCAVEKYFAQKQSGIHRTTKVSVAGTCYYRQIPKDCGPSQVAMYAMSVATKES